MTEVSTAQIRRSLDRSRRRKPLRLQITRRRRTADHGSAEHFVTQVRFGGGKAVVVPWEDGTHGLANRPSK
jgi:hypothetical protein